uniref:Transient receptor potential cation channel subfamily M member 2-like n=1 Tax=Saccoglossus kowalevskii TaxID=10224 RepID=A0ABM0LYQ3_SACKO
MASMSYEMRKADRLRKRSGSVDSQERDELHHDDDRGHRRHREKHRKRRKYRSPNNKVHDSSEDCPHKEVYDNPSYRHSESRRARRGLKHSDDENQKERRQRREPVQEVLVVQHEEENLGAGLGILEHKSEQQWNTDVSSFMKENKIKQRNGPDKQVDADSYGEIEFIGFGQHNKKSPYVRVDMETEPHILWDLLINQWKMDKPKVLISVTGGAQDFFFKDRLKLLFNKGLFKAAVSTGAWIITGGTAVGVMKKVGEAIMEESQGITSDNQKQVVALGIATWTMIDNKKALEGRPGGGGLWPAQYKESDLGKEKKSALDSNHTHFILVDHGKETFGADIRLRANLEKYIAEKTERETVHIPVVLVVVEGGYGTFQTVYESLVREGNEQSVPVVVVDGSGRAADVIALCLRKTKDVSKENLKKTYRKNLEKNMKESIQNFVRLKDDQMKQTLDWLAVIMTHRNMITVFQMQEANFKDIDRAILHGLLQ